jgi:LDH2 family malate/lactate/ureidoglycolate dehydrogenase
MISAVDAGDLAGLAAAILMKHTVSARDAELVADSLVQVELWGHASHGMLRLPRYTARLRSGAMRAVTEVGTISDTGSLTVLDGRGGIGQVGRGARRGDGHCEGHGARHRTVQTLRELATSSSVAWTLTEKRVDPTPLTPGLSLRS